MKALLHVLILIMLIGLIVTDDYAMASRAQAEGLLSLASCLQGDADACHAKPAVAAAAINAVRHR